MSGNETFRRQYQVADSVRDLAVPLVLGQPLFFHGREVRNVRGAAGGMNFVLHLSADDDPEGWTQPERQDYNGWGHDSGRPWRKLAQWEAEGVTDFREKFGSEAYGLHHRFFFHLDEKNRFWLSAEDGCEGYAADASTFITR